MTTKLRLNVLDAPLPKVDTPGDIDYRNTYLDYNLNDWLGRRGSTPQRSLLSPRLDSRCRATTAGRAHGHQVSALQSV